MKKENKYIIIREDTDLHVQWDRKTIIFDTEKEANVFIDIFKDFFDGVKFHVVIEDLPLNMIMHINYNDLVKTKDFIQTVKLFNNLN